MAKSTIQTSALRIGFEAGIGAKGELLIKRKVYSNVKPEAGADQLLEAAQAIAGLQELPLAEVIRQDAALVTA